MTNRLVCNVCHRQYDPTSLAWRCICGGLLDLAPFSVSFSLGAIPKHIAGLWRHHEALPFASTYTG